MYDASGRLVRTLLTGVSPAGQHVVTWDGTDQSGLRIARGVCLCRLTVDEARSTERVIFMR